ncbi:efflux RND transporter periplasmic adaptor subunit [Paraflavitalea pollutisoli]|uniref:efflux RND transporter periplasmic adaptor subunit n=1 Tax=Paraflavitalea pollutisoli TaxID=3034143 RepID=UPI0023ED690E|nr:efflux RND transporter periplasmic adaptor subunit [Paraflavitalea sp. H1-2-19X]
MKKVVAILWVVSIVLLQVSCGGNNAAAEKEAGAAAQEDEAHENSHTATLTGAQIKSIGIEIGHIEEKQLTASVRANGVLRVPNQNKAQINSLYSGVVQRLLIQPGDVVKKGQVIATLSNPEFIVVQEEYLSIHPRIVLAQQELQRQQELNQGNAGALKNLQAAESNLRSLQTRASALQQQIQLMGINPASLSNGSLVSVVSIRTPIGGIVSSVTVQMGSFVNVSTAIAEIVDNSQLHLDLFVYEKDLSKLKNNQQIHFTLTNNPGKEYDAQIYSLGSSFEDESKAVSVHARVNGDKTGLIDGMTITALISLDKVTTPAVPNEAIVTDKGQDYIFMVTDSPGGKEHHEKGERNSTPQQQEQHTHKGEEGKKGVTFEKVAIAKGTSEVGYTQITLLKPIPGNAKIVTRGAFFVLAKINNAGEGEHGH